MSTLWTAEAIDQVREEFPGLVEFFSSIDSTNNRAAELEESPALILAAEQSAGRGRRGRVWFAEPGAVILSLRLNPDDYGIGPERRPALSLLAAIAAADAVGEVPVRLKWPNDLFLYDRKLSGILLEGSADAVIIGMGLNFNNRLHDAPEEIRELAISLADVTQREGSLPQFVIQWWMHLESLLRAWGEHALQLEEIWAGRDHLAGREVTLDLGSESVTGVARGLSSDGEFDARDRRWDPLGEQRRGQFVGSRWSEVGGL